MIVDREQITRQHLVVGELRKANWKKQQQQTRDRKISDQYPTRSTTKYVWITVHTEYPYILIEYDRIVGTTKPRKRQRCMASET